MFIQFTQNKCSDDHAIVSRVRLRGPSFIKVSFFPLPQIRKKKRKEKRKTVVGLKITFSSVAKDFFFFLGSAYKTGALSRLSDPTQAGVVLS